MTDNGDGKKIDPEDSKEVICEFFGIKIATKNPNLAKVLKTEVSDLMNLDVHQVKDYIKNQDDFDGEEESESLDEDDNDISDINASTEPNNNSKLIGDNDDIDIDKLVKEYLDRNY